MIEFLQKASKAYYEGNPIISDAEYDALEQVYGKNNVGYVSSGTIPHMFPMFSLAKCYDITNPPFPIGKDVVTTPKLDGAAISTLYVDGTLVLALTRGDGTAGRDITDKVKCLVPEYIDVNGVIQVTGEVVAHADIPNSRNYASGALNLKSLDEFKTRIGLAFIAYGLESSVPFHSSLWTDLMRIVQSWGFNTVTSYKESIGDVFPTDGRVYRINNIAKFKAAGYTSSFPKGAFALKDREVGPTTKLLGVDWQVGKSGVVSPVAILEPVMVGDAKVSRATLHNIEYIRALGLEIGCDVEVIRAGEIIPRVVRRV